MDQVIVWRQPAKNKNGLPEGKPLKKQLFALARLSVHADARQYRPIADRIQRKGN